MASAIACMSGAGLRSCVSGLTFARTAAMRHEEGAAELWRLVAESGHDAPLRCVQCLAADESLRVQLARQLARQCTNRRAPQLKKQLAQRQGERPRNHQKAAAMQRARRIPTQPYGLLRG
jgi:hypothetical protein